MLKMTIVLLSALMVLFGLILTFTRSSKVKTVRDFFLHGETMQLGYLVGSLVAANLSLSNLIFVCAILGYSYGWSGVLWVAITIVMIFIGFISFAHRFKDYIQEKGNFGTIHDFISSRHASSSKKSDKTTRQITAVMSCVSLWLAIIIETHLATKLISPLVDVSQPVLVLMFIALVSIYTIGAGFYSVVFTDIMQCLFVACAALAGTYLLCSLPRGQGFEKAGYVLNLEQALVGVGWPTAVGLVVLGFFWLISTPDTWQRNCATRDLDTSMRGAALASMLLIGWVCVFAIAGMTIKAVVEPNITGEAKSFLSNGAFPFNDMFLLDFDRLGFKLNLAAGIVATGLLMAAISTVDTFLIVIGHVMNTDLGLADRRLKSFTDVRTGEDEALLLRGKLLILLVSGSVFMGWLLLRFMQWLDDPISMFFVTYTLQFSLAIPAIAATYESTRSTTVTNAVVIASGGATAALGMWALTHNQSTLTVYGLLPNEWMALLPCIPVAVGLIGYASLRAIREHP